MAKAFICLNGISNFSGNQCSARELLQEQTIEFLVKRSLKDCKEIVLDSLHIVPNTLESLSQYGLVKTMAKIATNSKIKENVRKSLDDLNEMLDLMRLSHRNEVPIQSEQPQQKTKHLSK